MKPGEVRRILATVEWEGEERRVDREEERLAISSLAEAGARLWLELVAIPFEEMRRAVARGPLRIG